MAINLDRKSPGVIGVFFGATLSIALGALLAVVHLASQPVEVVKARPKEPAAGARYYVLGAAGGTAGKSWEVKRETLAAGVAGAVTFTEAELNAWSEASFEPAKVDDAKKNESVMIIAGTPNFRVDGSDLRVGQVNTMNFFGSEAPLVLQARGTFAKDGSSWRYVPSEVLLGAFPLHKIPALVPAVAARFGMPATTPVEVEKVLKGANEIAVRDGALVIAMP